MQDMMGNTLELGDHVAYPASVGNSMKAEMVVGRLVGLKLRDKRVLGRYDHELRKWESTTVEVVKAQVRPLKRSRSQVAVPYPVSLENTMNLLKVQV